MNNYLKNALLPSLFMLLIFSSAFAEKEVTEGYDENTEVTVNGTIKVVLQERRGPKIFILQAANRDYRVVTAPWWYIAQEGIRFETGAEFEVTGSKYIAPDGFSYIVASRLKNLSTGKITPLRDSAGMPLWKGRMMRRGSGSGT